MELKGVEEVVRDGRVYLSCVEDGCCGMTQEVGVQLTRQELIDQMDNCLLGEYI